MAVPSADQALSVHRDGAIGHVRVGEHLFLWWSRHGRDSAAGPRKSGQVWVRTPPRGRRAAGSAITLLPGCDRAVERRRLCQEVWIHIYQKIDVSSRAAAALFANENGLLDVLSRAAD
jgi:hypothetical protein